MLLLAKYFLQRGDMEGCEQQCNALLRVNPACEDAIMILADLMLRKNRFEDAAFHFHQLLDKKPDNFNALVHYVKLLRRSGHLQDASAAFTAAEALVRPGQKPDPGLCYAKGLYNRYINKSTEALMDFNAGRLPKDNPWSQQCLVCMIEIYIMPDNENLWEDSENRETLMENINTAERLLGEVVDTGKRSVLEGYCLLATKKRDSLEKAVAKFFEIVADADAANGVDPNAQKASADNDGDGTTSTEQVHVPGLVGLATALQLMKQTPKARNHLKRVAKVAYRPEFDDDFERGWLLLSDIYIANGKYDLAQELLRRTIQVNKSCCRAWEYMGLIFEKEQSYKDAADCYENAWKLVQESDPGIGFKLAFNYLKARKLVQSIDTCHKVLAKHPSYPKIKKEVLERARSLIRP
jgi:tetratricopeptide repeat protein 21B